MMMCIVVYKLGVYKSVKNTGIVCENGRPLRQTEHSFIFLTQNYVSEKPLFASYWQ
jgi:hypothetical protein